MQAFVIKPKTGPDRYHVVTVLENLGDNKFLCHKDNDIEIVTLEELTRHYKYVSLAR